MLVLSTFLPPCLFENERVFFYSVPRVIDQDLERYEPLEEEDHRGARVPFNLEETYDQSFRANSFNGTWKTDREILYSDNYVGDIRLFDVTTGSGTVLLDSSVTVSLHHNFANYCSEISKLKKRFSLRWGAINFNLENKPLGTSCGRQTTVWLIGTEILSVQLLNSRGNIGVHPLGESTNLWIVVDLRDALFDISPFRFLSVPFNRIPR